MRQAIHAHPAIGDGLEVAEASSSAPFRGAHEWNGLPVTPNPLPSLNESEALCDGVEAFPARATNPANERTPASADCTVAAQARPAASRKAARRSMAESTMRSLLPARPAGVFCARAVTRSGEFWPPARGRAWLRASLMSASSAPRRATAARPARRGGGRLGVVGGGTARQTATRSRRGRSAAGIVC